MADNTVLNSGTGGDTIATDDISGVKYPRSKMVLGADGTNDGDVSSSNPMPCKGTGTAGTANAGVMTVQGIASMTPVQVSQATASNLNATVVGTGTFVTQSVCTNAGTFAVQAVCTNAGTFAVQSSQSGTWTVALSAVDNAVLDDISNLLGAPQAALDDDSYAGAGVWSSFIAGAVRKDSVTALADTDGKFTPLQTDSFGRLRVILPDKEVTNAGTFAVQVSNTTTVTGTGGTFPVTDSGGSLTVDNNGTFVVQAAQSGTWTVTGAGGTFPVTDNSGSLTVDAPVGTPVFVRLSDGSSAITTLAVSLATVPSHAVTNAGTFAVQVDGAALTALQLIDNPVVVDDAAFTPGTTSVMMAGFQADETATDSVDEGDGGAARMTLDRKMIVTVQPHTKGDCSMFRSIDIDESEEEIKASAGNVYGIHCMNLTAALLYLKFYNATAANVTVGTTTPVLTFPVPGNGDTDGAGFTFNLPQGITFDTAISVACTTGLADNDTGAPAANACVVNVFYM